MGDGRGGDTETAAQICAGRFIATGDVTQNLIASRVGQSL